MNTDKELILSAEELYYLGTLMKAEVIDYAYIAAMKDVGDKYEVFLSTTKDSLSKKGLLIEDFSGELEVDESAKAILKPVFFGKDEGALDVCYMIDGNERDTSSMHFHYYDDKITLVDVTKDKMVIKAVSEEDINDTIKKLGPEKDVEEVIEVTENELDYKQANKVLAVKRTTFAEVSINVIYVECNGIMYKELDDDNEIVSMTRADFEEEVYRILREV